MRWNELLCVPDILLNTNEQGFAPCNLVFRRTDYFNLSISVLSLPVLPNYLGDMLCLKSLPQRSLVIVVPCI